MIDPLAILLAASLLAAEPSAAPATALERLQAMHLEEAARWRMVLGDGKTTTARLNTKPIYIWTNPTRSQVQHGSVFTWMHNGRPVVVGSIFSHPEQGRRMVCHEFHSLAEGALRPERGQGEEGWTPQAPVPMLPLPDAPPPDSSPARRLLQMRSLAREFTSHSIDYREERWELRLLSQPLYRYEKPEGDVIDGALFALVTSAGTDPEVILVLEARQSGGAPAWRWRAIRFSDSNLYVQRRGKEVWTSIRDNRNQLHFNPDHTYRLIRDKHIDELPELAQALEEAQ
jgi:hypothetical protein